MRNSIIVIFLFFCFHSPAWSAAGDTTFIQPFSEKSVLHPSLQGAILKKVAVDFNNTVYVLTDKGVGRIFNNQIIKDLRFRPLQDRIPEDISIQEGTGFLYYLFNGVLLSNEQSGTPYFELPAGAYSSFQVSRNGEILLKGKERITHFKEGKWHEVDLPEKDFQNIYVNNNIFYGLSPDALYILKDEKFSILHRGKNLQALTFVRDEIIIGTSDGIYPIDKKTGKGLSPLKTSVPIPDIRLLSVVNGRLWAGTPHGTFMEKENGRYDYYASKRWLLEDSITGLANGNNGDIYFLSKSGVSRISFKTYSYHAKADLFQEKIRDRHIRYGLLAEVRMKVPGDLTSAEMVDTDNDGLWSSFYLGSQAFRYAVTGEEIAREYAWETFSAYERLVSINPLKGFPSRTFERKGFKVSDPLAWRIAKDTNWEWKGTTSSDEFVGYIFVTAMMDQYIAKTKEEKKRVAHFIDTILTHIITNNYNFVDLDGQPTRWGRWNPDYINSYAKTISDRKLGAVHIIAGLQLGYALTGKPIYKNEAMRLMKEHGYLENIMISPYDIKATPGYIYDGADMGMGPWNHSDDEMEFLSFWVLHHYALNKELRIKYDKAIKEFWQIERPEKHPVWNLITLGTEGSFDKESTLWYLREFPVDQIRWYIKNSIRKDLDFQEPGFRQQFTKEVISPRERPAHRYNSNEFILDGGDGGREELTGAEYLLPYWMARYFNVIP